MKEAILYKKDSKNKVKCLACSHYCSIENGKRGVCRVRENKDGELYSLIYGKIVAENVDPVEKKPLFHFMPGSAVYSYASVGCNMSCDNCLNWQISQYSKLQNDEITGRDVTPDQVVESAIKNDCKSIAATYTEPTIFVDFALEVMKKAKAKDIKNIWVTNGYFSEETQKEILPYLDAVNIDLKYFDNDKYIKHCGAKLEPVLKNLQEMKKAGVWVEVTTLLIPTISDDEKNLENIANFIYDKLGKETPWHISKFSPEISYKLQKLSSTPTENIIKAIQIGRDAGLENVYAGNLWDMDLENTHCPNCGEIVINRKDYQTTCLYKGCICPECKSKLDIIL